MNFDLTDEQRMIADTVADVVRDTTGTKAWDAFADTGLTGMTFSEAVDGAGLGLLTIAPALMEIGKSADASPIIGAAILPGLLTARGRFPDLDTSSIMANETRAAVVLPDNAATLHAENGLLNGSVQNVLGGADADILLLCLEGKDETLCGVVDLRADGVKVSKLDLLDGQSAADINFDTVAVTLTPADPKLANWMQDVAALCLCAKALGAAQAMRDLTRDYIKTREQFGKPIGRFQVLQHQMVDIFHDTEHFESLVLAAASACDEGDVTARQKAVSALKRFCGTRMRAAAASGVQMHGGIGMTEEYELGGFVKRILIADMLFGTSDDHARRLGSLVAQAAKREATNFGAVLNP